MSKLLEEHAIHQALSLLSDTVTCKVACMRLVAIGLVFYPIHSFENVVGADMPRCFSLSGANTKPDLIDSYVL